MKLVFNYFPLMLEAPFDTLRQAQWSQLRASVARGLRLVGFGVKPDLLGEGEVASRLSAVNT